MSLDYEFAPIDVSITTHPKAFAAGVEAMGLWLWGIAFAKQHASGGRLHRAAVLGAWGGRRNIMLAKRLVEAGLWVVREDGDWDIHNFEKKGPGLTSSADRMRRLRERRRSSPPPSLGDASDVTVTSPSDAGDANSDVTKRHRCSPSLSSSDLNSSLPDKIPNAEVFQVPRPAWVDAVIATVAMATGEMLHADTLWLGYTGSRDHDGRSYTRGDFQKYTTSWASRQKREREREPKTGQRLRQPLGNPATLPWLKTGGGEL